MGLAMAAAYFATHSCVSGVTVFGERAAGLACPTISFITYAMLPD